MNTDLSVAPEIAQLADPFVPVLHTAVPRTEGRVAGDLADLAATPERWWDLVRFDHDGPVRVSLPDEPGAWLLVLPPGATADCDCQQATALAGEAVEAVTSPLTVGTGTGGTGTVGTGTGTGGTGTGVQARPLRPGRVRVHGTRAPHRVRAVGHGYSVTLHWTATRGRFE